jgi:hypothetical protein
MMKDTDAIGCNALDGWSLEQSRLGAALGLRVLSIIREGTILSFADIFRYPEIQ